MSKYWETRQEKRENLAFDKGTEAYKEYVKTLEQAKENINAKIAKLYANHSRDTGLSKAETMKIIQGKEYKEWRYKIEDYVKKLNLIKDKNSIEFKKLSLELETLASRSRINRLESLKADIDMELIKAGAKANDTMTDTLTKTYTDTYKSLVEDLKFKSTVDMDRVKKVMGYDWSGSNYSKRIWGNTEALAKTVKNEVLIGLNQGINYKTMSKRIADKFETSKKNAERLVRTEINYIHNQATVDGYKDAGIEKYQFLATLDSRTSQTCAGLNGEVFELKDVAVGINYPPMHPRCRSTTVPIIDYASLQNIKEGELKDVEEKENLNEKFNWNYDNSLTQTFGKTFAEEIYSKIDEIQDEDLKTAFRKNIDKIEFKELDSGKSYHRFGKVYLNKNDLKISPDALFHEMGHALDGLLAKKGGLSFISMESQNFAKIITNEVNEILENVKNELKKNKNNIDELVKKGYVDEKSATFFKSAPNFLTKKGSVYGALKNKILSEATINGKLNHNIYGDLSDIIEGATLGELQIGVGHGKKYWKDRLSMNGDNIGLVTEAFAEMTSSIATNPESLKMLEKYLPKSLEAYKEIVKSSINGDDK